MIYEYRVYTAMPGRLPDIMARFRDYTLGIWDRIGIRAEGFWTPLIGPINNDLTYYLVWESLAQREDLWTKFLADPEWQAARAASEANGPLLSNVASQFLTPTPFARLR